MSQENNNNLGLGLDAFAGTNIEKGFTNYLEKGKRVPVGTVTNGNKKIAEGKWVPVKKEKGPKKGEDTPSQKSPKKQKESGDKKKSAEPTPDWTKDKKEEEKKEPTPAETAAGEHEAGQATRDLTKKNDEAHTFDKLDSAHKGALKVLVNMEGKTASEKIEDVSEQYGVSKVAAINLLSEAARGNAKDQQGSQTDDQKEAEEINSQEKASRARKAYDKAKEEGDEAGMKKHGAALDSMKEKKGSSKGESDPFEELSKLQETDEFKQYLEDYDYDEDERDPENWVEDSKNEDKDHITHKLMKIYRQIPK